QNVISNSMRLSYTGVLLTFFTIVSFISCSQPSILGDWKPEKITTYNEENVKLVMDLSDLEKLTNELFQAARGRYTDSDFDSTSLINNIRNSLSNFQKTNLSLKANDKFVMNNYNLLVLAAIPGWHMSDTLFGKWSLRNDTLTLSMGEEMFSVNWKFKVKENSPQILRIEEIDGYSDREILFRRQ
nr:hypothetical protein [Saprospiraceae bacterium]